MGKVEGERLEVGSRKLHTLCRRIADLPPIPNTHRRTAEGDNDRIISDEWRGDALVRRFENRLARRLVRRPPGRPKKKRHGNR